MKYAVGNIVIRAPRPSNRLAVSFAIALMTIITAGLSPARASDTSLYQTSQGVAVYIGLIPATIIRGYNSANALAGMHGGAPAGQHQFHLVVAVFDTANGARISDATVRARVVELGHAGAERALEPMKIAGTTTYGGFIELPFGSKYTIQVEVHRPRLAPIVLDFPYDHQP